METRTLKNNAQGGMDELLKVSNKTELSVTRSKTAGESQLQNTCTSVVGNYVASQLHTRTSLFLKSWRSQVTLQYVQQF